MFGLWFIKSCTTETLRRRLIEALVLPHLDYCSVVYLDASQGFRERLQRLSNTCVRYIFGLRKNARITPYRRRLGWLRIDSRRWYFSAILMYKIMRMGQPSYLRKMFTLHTYDRPIRGEIKELRIPFMGPGRGILSFQVQCAQFWNSLLSSLRFLPSLSRFKKILNVNTSSSSMLSPQ